MIIEHRKQSDLQDHLMNKIKSQTFTLKNWRHVSVYENMNATCTISIPFTKFDLDQNQICFTRSSYVNLNKFVTYDIRVSLTKQVLAV